MMTRQKVHARLRRTALNPMENGSNVAVKTRRGCPSDFCGNERQPLDALVSGGRPMGIIVPPPPAADSTPSDDTPTSVYRYYDRREMLLYVGVTSRGIRRNREHNATKEWWQYVVSQQVDHYLTRTAALAAEKRLILKHRPPFNTAHNPEAELVRATYLTTVLRPHRMKKKAKRPKVSFALDLVRINDENGMPAYRTQPGEYALAQNLLYTGNARVIRDGAQVGWVSKYTFKAVAGVVRLKLTRPAARDTQALITYCRNSNDAPDRLRILSVVMWGGS